jgi:hypothetical protein
MGGTYCKYVTVRTLTGLEAKYVRTVCTRTVRVQYVR